MRTLAFAAAALLLCAAVRAQDEKTLEKPAPETQAAPTTPAEKAPARAEETAKPEPKAEKAEPAPEKKEPAKPAEKADATPAAKAQPKPEAAATDEKPVDKPLNAGAAKYAVIGEGYAKAADDFRAWLKGASETLDKNEAKVAELKKQIEDNAGQATKLELQQTADASKQARALKAKNDELWRQLKGEQSRHELLLRALGRAVEQKTRELDRALEDKAHALAQ